MDLFAAQLPAQLRAARQQQHRRTLDAMNTFCRAWAGTHDAVLYCCDRFSQHEHGDPYRTKVLDLQISVGSAGSGTFSSAGG